IRMHTAIILATALSLLLLQISAQQTENEVSHSTSVAGMVKLLDVESKLIENLDNYATQLERKLEAVRSYVADMRAENDKAKQQTESYLSNPLNAFALIRRMHQDWLYWRLYMEQPVGHEQAAYVPQMQQHLPTSTDLEEAAASIHRIQLTYDMKAADMSSGLLNGRQYNVSLSSLDRYALGKHHFDRQNFGEACQWIYQAIQWLDGKNKLPRPLALDRAELFQLYGEALIKMNRFNDALQVFNNAVAFKQDNAQLLQRRLEVEALTRTNAHLPPQRYSIPQPGAYELGCRGGYPSKSNLYCFYNHTTSAFLRLAPIKMELLALDPYMVLYHDIVTSKEIQELQYYAVPNLMRATVFDAKTGRNNVVKTRTSKVTWLPDAHSELTRRLNRRITDMTGFDMYGSEMLQVMNYGLGGHYDKHFDYFNATTAPELTKMNGDRIATVLFYLTDVEQGGATVFPNIGKAIFPKRGTAVMWYNLRHDGNGDPQTQHAACPVIVGSKWATTKWIRERQQLFTRPCEKM
ncbi:PH4alphaPV, partial [Drosophila busckii]